MGSAAIDVAYAPPLRRHKGGDTFVSPVPPGQTCFLASSRGYSSTNKKSYR